MQRDHLIKSNTNFLENNQIAAIQEANFHGWFYNISFVLIVVGVLSEGILYEVIYPALATNALPLFRNFPFQIMPSDLFLMPFAFFIAFIALAGNGETKKSGQGKYFLIYLLVCIYGVVLGLYRGNTYVRSDIQDFLIRPLLSVIFYVLGARINLSWSLNKIINFSIILAILEFGRAIVLFINGKTILYPLSWRGELLLLFPYTLVLVSILSGRKIIPGATAKVILLGLGITIPLSKPVVGAFIITNILVIIFITTFLRDTFRKVFKYFFLIGFLLTAIGSFYLSSITVQKYVELR